MGAGSKKDNVGRIMGEVSVICGHSLPCVMNLIKRIPNEFPLLSKQLASACGKMHFHFDAF